MTDKKKRTLLTIGGSVLCLALLAGVILRFGSREIPAGRSTLIAPSETPPAVSITVPTPSANTGAAGENRPGAGADSDGTVQSIQGDPANPSPPDSLSDYEKGHGGADVPENERNTSAPPSYRPDQTTVTPPTKPQAGSSNGNGQVYVPGFGYVDGGGESKGTVADDMYESGEKVGIMD